MTRKLLILGGTIEARNLVSALSDTVEPPKITYSIAGRTHAPNLPDCTIRVGGFGGIEGLEHHLKKAGYDAVINATHPFAAQITSNAAIVCAALNMPLLRLDRPSWKASTEDRWISARDEEDATHKLAGADAARVFLTVGRQTLLPFTRLKDVWFLIRAFQAPEGPLPFSRYEIVHDQPPFDAAGEQSLMLGHHIDHLVTKNSGGIMTAAKLEAARALKIPVVMIERPPLPDGDKARTIDDAVAWLEEQR